VLSARREFCQKYINDYIRLGLLGAAFAFAAAWTLATAESAVRKAENKRLRRRTRTTTKSESSLSPKKPKLVTVVMAVKVKECVKVVW